MHRFIHLCARFTSESGEHGIDASLPNLRSQPEEALLEGAAEFRALQG